MATNSQPPDNNGSRVGVIGLGLLGTALAERLLDAGFETLVHNRTKEKSQPLIERGAKWSDNPLAECDRVVICLFDTEAVEAVLNELKSGLRPNQILIDTTTGNPAQTAALGARLAQQQVSYLESPIAASSDQTRNGEAVALLAGEQTTYELCQDIFAAISKKHYYLGPWGSAATMKLVNNLVLGLTRAALAEGLVLAKAAGLPPRQTLEVLANGNAHSVVLDVKGQKMIEREFSTQAKLSQHLKDVRLILEEGEKFDLALPISSLHQELLKLAESSGLGELDNCAIIQTIESMKASGR